MMDGESPISSFLTQNWKLETLQRGLPVAESEFSLAPSIHFQNALMGTLTLGEVSLAVRIETHDKLSGRISLFLDKEAELDSDDLDAAEEPTPLMLLPFEFTANETRKMLTSTGNFVEKGTSGRFLWIFTSPTEFTLQLWHARGFSTTVHGRGDYTPPPQSFWGTWWPSFLIMGVFFVLQVVQGVVEGRNLEQQRKVQAAVTKK